MNLRPCLVLSLVSCALAACSTKGDAPAPSGATTASTVALPGNAQPGGLGALASGAAGQGTPPKGGAFAAGRPGDAPAAPAPGGDLLTMFVGKPSAGVKPSETIHGAGGVFAGLPVGYSSSDWNTEGYADQCVYLFPKGQEGKHYICLKQVSGEPNQTDLRKEAYGALWDKAEFDGWAPGKAGFLGYSAKITHGKGTSIVKNEGEREGYALLVDVPGKKSVLLLGSWSLQKPDDKQAFLEVVKGLGTCTFQPKKGCVTDKPYDG